MVRHKASAGSRNEPHLAEKLGREGLRALKEKVASPAETQEIVTTEVGAPQFWWHEQQKHLLREEDKGSYWNQHVAGEPTIPWRQSVAMRNAAGHLWPILKEAGYLARQATSPTDILGRWANWPSFTTAPAANARPYYHHAFHGLPHKLQELMEPYEALIPRVEEKGRAIRASGHSTPGGCPEAS